MMVRADEAEHGQVLRRTRNAGRVYYTLPAASSGATVDARRSYYIRQLRAREVKLTGGEQALLRYLEGGDVPLWRHRRYTDADGERRERTDLVAAPADYTFRVVATKPGWR